ncbi:MAG: hypothetical protein M3R30_02750 [Candidatus Eremiobacteraeota bacterium]|nr:hypothetical protein [Candidatus Eremiobacteraeota bacterium]
MWFIMLGAARAAPETANVRPAAMANLPKEIIRTPSTTKKWIAYGPLLPTPLGEPFTCFDSGRVNRVRTRFDAHALKRMPLSLRSSSITQAHRRNSLAIVDIYEE